MTWLLVTLYRRSLIFWIALAILVAGALVASWAVMVNAISGGDVRVCLGLVANFDPASQPEGGAPACSTTALDALDHFRTAQNAISLTIIALPLILGMFVAAPLMGRELENGTHRLIWTQSVTPNRWIVARMSLVIAFTVALLLVVAIATYPWLSLGSIVWLGSPWPGFDIRILALVSYGVFAVAVGAAAATMTGRTVAAMAITAVVWGGIRGAFEILVRPHLMQPLIERGMTAGTSGNNWYLGITYIDRAGHTVSWDRVSALLSSGSSLQSAGISLAGLVQPADRFWSFQGIEATFYIGLSAVCVVLAITWVRLRLASV